MSISLSIGTRQGISISPRMQQAIRLLQMSAIDFELELRNSLVSNPFLEESEDDVTPPEAAESPIDTPIVGTTSEASTEVETAPTLDEALVALPLETDRIQDDFAFEQLHSASANDDEGPQLGWVGETRGLRDHLRAQVYASRCTDRESLAAEVVIETLDDDGYLRNPIEESLLKVEVDPPFSSAEIESAIALVRGFDPVGVGATSLIECLLLQLRARPSDTPGLELATTILDRHLDVLARRDFIGLQRRLGCEEGSMREALALIRRLDPDPASRYASKAPDYVVPDVIVQKIKGRFVASLNPSVRSNARLNSSYVDMFRACRRSQHPQMAQQLQEARWLVRNVEQRFDTILRVASYIVHRQYGFFEVGDIALKPMVLREVADELGLHESTVSRATGNKYMATPRGCVEFKHFFSRELPMRDGPSCSAAAVRNLIQGLIGSEEPNTPLSDVDIAHTLQSQGIRIARRTVTKYRRMLKVPPAEFRRVM